MLLTQSDLLFDDPFAFMVLAIAVIVSLVVGISVHEFSHAAAATALGDPTSSRLGRLTLNPKAHLDPAGSVMLLVAGFGWGRPVPVNTGRLRGDRRGMAAVSVAGPVSNLVLALLVGMVFQAGLLEAGDFSRTALRTLDPLAWLTLIATYSVLLNMILAAFNLLPLFPLDGGNILRGVAPRQWLPAVSRLERVGPVLLIGAIGLSVLTNVSVLGFFFDPVLDLAWRLISV